MFEHLVFHTPTRWLPAFAAAFVVVAGLIWWRWLGGRTYATVRYSSVSLPARLRGGWVLRLRHLVPILRTVTVGLVILCLMGPQRVDEQSRIFAEGIAIQMVIDLSGSMENDDFIFERKRTTRLDMVKNVFREFVAGDGDALEGRKDDLIGLIGFARHADSMVPLTLDHDNVLAVLEEVETKEGPTVRRRRKELDLMLATAAQANDARRHRQAQAELQRLDEENQTAIGDAMALAVVRLRDLDERLTKESARKTDANAGSIKGKVIILLTDGENNAGDLTPEQVGPLIKASGIRLYAIGIGSQAHRGAIADEEKMQEIARQTGGEYFRATDSRSLREVYAAIDKLEKTKTEEQRFMQYKSLATSWTRLGKMRVPPLLLIVVGLLVVEVLLSNTRFRRLP